MKTKLLWTSALLCALALLPVDVCRAHGGPHQGARPIESLWQAWTFDPWVLTPILLASVCYAYGAYRLRKKAARTPGMQLRPGEWAFFAGMLAVVIALVSPLDAVSDVLFSAHMSQHELLMLVAAPLLVLSRPWQAYLAACSPALRARVAGAMRNRRVVVGWRVLTAPVLVVLLHAFVRWIWHAPSLFQAALASEWVHGFQHATFFISAALFWWALMAGRYGPLGYGVSVLFVFATALHTGALGALLTFTREVWYPVHAARTLVYAADPLADQQLAGLIMWIPAGVLMLSIGLGLFAAWLGALSRREALAAARGK